MTKEQLRSRKKDFSQAFAGNISLDGVQLLIAFRSMKSEVDVSPVVQEASSKGIPVVFPESDPYCFDGVNLKTINCPALMLVPGLAFTKDGKRLGRGAGFYDRALSVLPKCVKTIGICKKSQIVDDIPMEEHDMKVQEVLAF